MRQKIIWASVAVVTIAILVGLSLGTRKWLVDINSKVVGVNAKVEGVAVAVSAAQAAKTSAEKAQSAAERTEKAVVDVKVVASQASARAFLAASSSAILQAGVPLAIWQAACGIRVDAADGPCTKVCMEGKSIPPNCFPGKVARAPKKLAPKKKMPSLPPVAPPAEALPEAVAPAPSPLRPRVSEAAPSAPASPAPSAIDPLAGLDSALGEAEGALTRTEAATAKVGERLETEEKATTP